MLELNKTAFFFAVFALFECQTSMAQNAFVTCGGGAAGTSGSTSFSVGLPSYQSARGSGGSTSNGIQNAFEIFIVGAYEAKDVALSVSAYPNPTVDYLLLNIESDFEQFSFKLYNLQGELLKSSLVLSNLTQIPMSDLPVSAYFIKVFKNNNEVIAYKIIKNN